MNSSGLQLQGQQFLSALTGTNYTGALSYTDTSYPTSILYYVFLILFVGFILLVLIHYTITPIFRFRSGDKGYIGIPGTTDHIVYWSSKEQPLIMQDVPTKGDTLSKYAFENNFSISVDLFIRRLPATNIQNRLVFFKGYRGKTESDLTGNPDSAGNNLTSNLISYMRNKASMVVYLNETNDLIVTWLGGTSANPIEYNAAPIRNIPLYTPFRLGIIAENNTFSVFLNGKQTFQKIIPDGIKNNSQEAKPIGNTKETSQSFYFIPPWGTESRTIFYQNVIVWERPVRVPELANVSPTLASEPDFGMDEEASESAACSM